MDETSVGLAYPGQKGNVVQQRRANRARPETYTEKATLAVRRGNVTYCAFVASEKTCGHCCHRSSLEIVADLHDKSYDQLGRSNRLSYRHGLQKVGGSTTAS